MDSYFDLAVGDSSIQIQTVGTSIQITVNAAETVTLTDVQANLFADVLASIAGTTL